MLFLNHFFFKRSFRLLNEGGDDRRHFFTFDFFVLVDVDALSAIFNDLQLTFKLFKLRIKLIGVLLFFLDSLGHD